MQRGGFRQNEMKMYRVTKAIIVKDGRSVREYEVNADTDDLELTRANILGKYGSDVMNEVTVELQYKILPKGEGEAAKCEGEAAKN